MFLPGEVVRALDDTAQRTRKPKSEIIRAAVTSYLSPDSAEATEAAITRRLDRMTRQMERLERDLTISNEAIALFVKAWLSATPVVAEEHRLAVQAVGRERYAGFVEALGRRLSKGQRLTLEVAADLGEDGPS